jgi:hypothetical protein
MYSELVLVSLASLLSFSFLAEAFRGGCGFDVLFFC